jgi:hypothetical protein
MKKKTEIRRPRIDKGVNEAIATLFLKHPDWTGKMIYDALQDYPKRQWPIPQLRSVQKILSEVKKNATGYEFRKKEVPWSLGNKDIDPEHLYAILGAAKLAKCSNKLFTTRQAKWCSLLSGSIVDNRTLLSFATKYADLELIHDVLDPNSPFDTSNLDAILTMTPWEIATACLTWQIKPLGPDIIEFKIPPDIDPKNKRPPAVEDIFRLIPYEPMTVYKPFKPMPIATDILEKQAYEAETSFILLTPRYPKDDILSMIRIPRPEGFSREQFIDMRVSMRKTLSELKFSQEQMRVYTLWLEYLAAGARVKTLQESEVRNRIKMVSQLRKWVKNHKLAKGSHDLLPFSPEGVGIGDTETVNKIVRHKVEPARLLKQVGHKTHKISTLI